RTAAPTTARAAPRAWRGRARGRGRRAAGSGSPLAGPGTRDLRPQQPRRLAEQLLDLAQEGAAVRGVDRTVVGGQGQGDHVAGDDLVADDPRAALRPADGQG